MESKTANDSNPRRPSRSGNSSSLKNRKETMEIEGYPVEGVSIAEHETCIIFPTLNAAFDIGRCPNKAISQDFMFTSHGHMDHTGGLPMYVSTRELRGEEFQLRKDLKVRAFKTYHRAPSQGYVIYNVKEKLKQEYVGLPGNETKVLRLSGLEITDNHSS